MLTIADNLCPRCLLQNPAYEKRKDAPNHHHIGACVFGCGCQHWQCDLDEARAFTTDYP